jgi:tRNA A-37 threonylcarbamoyl transferase component Bud32
VSAAPSRPTAGRPFALAGYRGLALPAVEEALRRDVLPDPMACARGGEPLRPSVSRLTSRVRLAGAGAVLLKVHRVRSLGEALRSLLRPGRARCEWDAARYLAAAGVPVAEALAVGEARRAGLLRSSFFAARFVPGLRPAHEALPARPPEEREVLLARLAALLRGLHDRGFDHRDLHAGNVLVGDGEAAAARLLVTDLHRSRLGAPVSGRARRRALARWLHSLQGVLDPGDRLRWLAGYLLDADLAVAQAPEIEARMARLERVRLRSRGKRCLRESTVYTLDVGRGRGARRRDLERARLEALLAAHDEEARPGRPGFAKQSRKGVVTRHGDAVVKERRPTSPWARLRDRLRPGRHAAGYRNAHRLLVRGVGTARPLAWIRRGGRVFTLYEDLSALPRLDHRARDLYRGASRAAQVRLRDACAEWLGRLHREGVYHGDLKGVNVLVEEGDAGFRLIDTDACRFFAGPVDLRRRVKNLAQLAASIPRAVTRTERLRWYRRYADAAALDDDPRAVARAVAAALRAKIVVVDEPIE